MFDLWNSLLRVTHYECQSAPGMNSVMGWEGVGTGTVSVDCNESSSTLYFTERGEFSFAANQRAVGTKNEWVWQRLSDQRIQLSHSRFGRDKQVELFDLVYQQPEELWLSEAAHICGDDLYSGKAAWFDGAVHFFWTISGPRKQENLHYRYTGGFWDT
jgi:hypothetical protein